MAIGRDDPARGVEHSAGSHRESARVAERGQLRAVPSGDERAQCEASEASATLHAHWPRLSWGDARRRLLHHVLR